MKRVVRSIERRVEEFFLKSKIRSVLIAVSGGADSVALLVGCTHIATRLNIKIEAVNCNFHLRGEESDRDSTFTARLCQSLGVKLHALEYDVDAYLKEHPGISTEMVCRDLRYHDFYRIAEERKLDRVAVAHNADDDIETMMLNMLRGSGTRGLKGMEVDNGKVIRPLLNVTRKEIEEYLESLGMEHITDSSNLSSEYRRNFIRREVIPLLESRWHGARKSLAKTVKIMKEENDIIENHYKAEFQRLCPDANTLLVYSEGVTMGTIVRFLEPFGGNSEIAKEIMESRCNKFKERIWEVSERYAATLERDRLIIIDMKEEETEPEFLWSEIAMTPQTMADVKSNKNHNIVYLPNDKGEYKIRRPEKGDRISPLGMRGKRLVSDIISDAKLDNQAKAQIRVLERIKDGEIIWVSGLKRSRNDLISEDIPICYKLEYHPT